MELPAQLIDTLPMNRFASFGHGDEHGHRNEDKHGKSSGCADEKTHDLLDTANPLFAAYVRNCCKQGHFTQNTSRAKDAEQLSWPTDVRFHLPSEVSRIV